MKRSKRRQGARRTDLPSGSFPRSTVRLDVGEYRIDLTLDEQHMIKAGAAALAMLQQTRVRSWDLWMTVAESLWILRLKVIYAIGGQLPVGRTYNLAFGEAMHLFGLYTDKATRSRLFDCLEHRSEIESWRASLDPAERRKLTHPASVWRHWKASRQQSNSPEPPR